MIEIVQICFGRVEHFALGHFQIGEQIRTWERGVARFQKASVATSSVDNESLTAVIFRRSENTIDVRPLWGSG